MQFRVTLKKSNKPDGGSLLAKSIHPTFGIAVPTLMILLLFPSNKASSYLENLTEY
jgi:hypothetical protein